MRHSSKYPFIILFFVVSTELIGFGLIVPVLPLLAKQFESSALMIGLLMASYSFAQFISSPILGTLSDYYGRKKLLIFSKLGTVLGYILMAFSKSFLPFLVSRLIDGFTGGNISVARAYVSDITTEENRSKGMAVIGIAFGTGFILGPAIGGFLYHKTYVDHFLPAMFAAGLSFLALLITFFFLKEPSCRIPSDKKNIFKLIYQLINKKTIAIILFISFVYMLIFSGFETSFAIFTNHVLNFNVRQNSWLFVYAGVLGMIIQGSIMRFNSIHVRRYCITGLIALGIGFFVMSLTHHLWTLLLGMGFFSIGVALSNTYLPTLISIQAKNHKGSAMGIYEGLSSLSRVIGPFTLLPLIVNEPIFSYAFLGCTLLVLAFVLFVSKWL